MSTTPDKRTPQSPPAEPRKPSPAERHPDGKPEDAGRYEDLEKRDSGNHRKPG